MIGLRVPLVYSTTKLLGEGAMGAVYLATSATNHRIVVKVIHPEWTKDPMATERFRREATIASRIQHPNVVKIYDSGTLDDGRMFIAMEWLSGKTLGEHARSWGSLLAIDALPILLQLCDGMQAMHAEGVVHRDLKPENVFICDEPAGLIKILDFGISKIVGAAGEKAPPLTAVGTVMGTPWYMAPEQAESAGGATSVSDIFSLGVIAFELLAGFRPYRNNENKDEGPLTFLTRYARVAQGAEPRPSLAASTPGRKDIPAAWIEVIDQAIDISPKARPQTIREFVEKLYRAVPKGEAMARRLAPGLFTGASPADDTVRAVLGDATRPGARLTAPHAAPVGLSTFHDASGQVATTPPLRSRLAIPVALGAVLLVGGAVAVAVVASGSDSSSPAAPNPKPTAVDAGASSDLDATDADTAPVHDAAVDAGDTDASARVDAGTKRTRPKSPDDID